MEQIDLVHVLSIQSTPLSRGKTRHVINGEQVNGAKLMVQFVTINDWRASLCEAAKNEERPVWIGWNRTPYGKTIRTVQRFTIVARNPKGTAA